MIFNFVLVFQISKFNIETQIPTVASCIYIQNHALRKPLSEFLSCLCILVKFMELIQILRSKVSLKPWTALSCLIPMWHPGTIKGINEFGNIYASRTLSSKCAGKMPLWQLSFSVWYSDGWAWDASSLLSILAGCIKARIQALHAKGRDAEGNKKA